ncbi:Retrovirus-related Pol polyprotein, partial [Mucuna pruriens]
MEEETSGKGSTLILRRPFLMTIRTKIDVHAGTLSMEFGDTLVQFNIFEAMKHPTEDHSLFGIDLLDEIVEECFQLNRSNEDTEKFAGSADEINCLGVADEEADHEEVQDLPNFEDDHSDIADLDFEVELSELLDQACNQEHSELPSREQVGQTDPSPLIKKCPSLPPMELKPLPSHLKYAYLDSEQQLLEQEDKLLKVLRQHKKVIGWKLSDLLGINPSICIHRILMEEEVKPIRQQQKRLNPTLLDMVKKEVTKLLVACIIYPILDSQWVSPVQVVPKKSGMTVMKNQQDELVLMRIQNSWRVCIDYKRLNQATHKDHFPLPFIDQMLEKLAGKSHYFFLDGFS